MKKKLWVFVFSILLISGCSINKIVDNRIPTTLNTILYSKNNLQNVFMNGYSFYLPKGLKIIDKSDYNLKINDKKNNYYLYIDTIAYYYHMPNTYEKKNDRYFSEIINNDGKIGYVDIVEYQNKYFVVLMYNYAKIESYVNKDDFPEAFINMCNILSTVKYNSVIINDYVGKKGTTFQEEKFNIFDSEEEIDNFLMYEEEYGTYKEKIDVKKDNDIIDIEDIVD